MKRKFLIGLGIIVVLLIVLPLIYIAYDRSLMPPAPEPLASAPPATPGESWEQYATRYIETHKKPNALEHYLKAFSLYTSEPVLLATHDIDSILKFGWTQPYPKAEEALRLNQAAIQEFLLGAQINHCEFPPDPLGFRIPVNNNYRMIMTMVKTILLSGKEKEKMNKPSEALDIYLAGVQLEKDFGQKDQDLISYLIAMASINRSSQQIRQLIQKGELTQADYRKIIAELNRINQEQTKFGDFLYEYDYRNRYTLVIRPFKENLALMRSENRSQSQLTKMKDDIAAIVMETYLYLNRGRLLKQKYDRAIAAQTKPYQEFMNIDWDKRMSYRDNIPVGYTRFMHEVSFLRLAQIEATIQLYYLEHKQWPKELNDLKPYISSIPLDPFNDKPFLWSIDSTGKTFIYSVGPDFKDNLAKVIYDPSNGVDSVGDVIP
ncbi:MAG: hypothetical protein ACE14V_02885 [bacterium]